MPRALTLANMALASLVLLALSPVISCMRFCTALAEYCPTAATAMSKIKIPPNPRVRRADMDRLLVFSMAGYFFKAEASNFPQNDSKCNGRQLQPLLASDSCHSDVSQ